MPLFNDVGEITDAIKTQETILDETRAQMADDFDFIFLVESGFDPRGDNYHEYVDSEPLTFFNKVLDGTNRAVITIQIKTPEDASEQQRRAASEGELFVFGAMNAMDRRLRQRGEPPLRESLAWYIAARGWLAMRTIVQVPAGRKDVIFDTAPWDPMHVTWEMGPDGLIWAAYKRPVTRAQIKSEYGDAAAELMSKNEGVVIDFWDREANSIIINNEFVKEPEPHRLDHVPVYIGAVGSMPTVLSREEDVTSESGEMLKYRGNSVLAAWRHLIGPYNEEVSFYQDIARLARDAPLVYYSEHGDKGLEDQPYGSFRVIRAQTGERLEPIEFMKAPPESAAVLSILQRSRQQATLPYPLAHGGSFTAESGRALAVRIEQTRSVYTPRTGALAEAYQWLSEEIVSQFKSRVGRKSVALTGYDHKGEFFRVTKKPSEVDPSWYFDVRVEPRLPRDQAEEINMAVMATTGGDGRDPLVSHGTSREEYLKLRDPDAEEDKIVLEQAERLPPYRIAKMVAALKKAGDEEAARSVAEWAVQQGMLAQSNGVAPASAPAPASAQVTNGSGMGQVAGPVAGAPAGPPAAQGPQPVADQQMEAIRQVVQATTAILTQANRPDLASALVAALQTGAPLPPDARQAIIAIVRAAGQEELAQMLIELFGMIDQAQVQMTGQPAAAG